MNAKATNVRRIRFLHVPEDATVYEVLSTTNSVHISSDGTRSPEMVSASAFMRRGRERTQLVVNDKGAASEYCLVLVCGDERQLPSGAVSSKLPADNTPARYDLVRGPIVRGPLSGPLTYAEGDILASLPVFVQRDGEDGSGSSFVSVVFRRSETALTASDRPEGGTYVEPVPPAGGWSDAPPPGTAPLWLSRARFTPEMTGETGARTPEWSVPAPCEDSSGIEFIYCKRESAPRPDETHPYVGVQGDAWGKDATEAVWMAVSIKNNGVWDTWKVVRVKGEKGDPGDKGDPGEDGNDGEDGKDAEVYEIALTSDTLNFDAEGTRSPSMVVATAWRTEGTVREAVTAAWCKGRGLRLECEIKNPAGDRRLEPNVSSPHLLAFSSVDAVGATNVTFRLVRGADSALFASKALLLQRAGSKGEKGVTGPMVPPPRLWGDYPAGYEFQSGGDGEERLDVVLYENTAGGFLAASCLVTHTKSAAHDPAKDNTALKMPEQRPYWQAQDGEYELLATKVLLAANAFIRLLSSQAVRVYKADGKTVNVSLGGGDWPFWIGATEPEDAPTRIQADGTFHTRKAVIEGDVVFGGRVKPLVTRITSANYRDYRVDYAAESGHPELGPLWRLDFRKLTGCVFLDSSLDSVASSELSLGFIIGSKYADSEATVENLEDYIGGRMRVVNETSQSAAVTGQVIADEGAWSATSPSISPGCEIDLRCAIRKAGGKKSIGWVLEYQGPK